MQNVDFAIEKNTLVIKVDLTKRFGNSKSGKTEIIATTGGNCDSGKDGIKFGLNVFVKPNGEAAGKGKGK